MFIDSHCHLTYAGLAEQQEAVVERALAAGVDNMVSISTRQDEWSTVVRTAEHYPQVFATVGVHPHEADSHQNLTVEELVQAAQHPKVVGIGETGLDYHYNHATAEHQRANFRRHITAARETQLPIVVHTREAEKETVAILKEELAAGSFPVIIHCFSGSQWLADACLALGAYISLSGILTFRKADDLRETAKTVPLERLLVETDSPFLAPVPLRGRTCEPAFVLHTAERLAELRGLSLAELGAITEKNTRAVFSKMSG